jgi:2,3-bisphosphoglycerate-independent phosphoglycerate mutase
MPQRPKPVVLVVLDGWGHREDPDSNAIVAAPTPVWDRLWRDHPHTLLRCSGAEVGLPAEQMGNSEVGHLNLGAGRVVYQDLTRISLAVRDGSFFANPALVEAAEAAARAGRALHILGLLSPGGVHSHDEHIHAMAELAVQRGVRELFVHAFLDGRDTPPRSAAASLEALAAKLGTLGTGRIASVVGRYYAMDRDRRWERTRAAYELLVDGRAGHTAPDAASALAQAYDRGEGDEFVSPTLVVAPGGAPVRIGDGDVVAFMNFRSDRARQLTRAFIEPGFEGFPRRTVPRLRAFVTLTEYHKEFDVPVAFPPQRLDNGLGEYLSRLGLRQLRIAETEKYAHVTFFFNGGIERTYEGEERILIPSPKVRTYDLAPQMSAAAVTDQLVEAVGAGRYDVIICNYANADMVGHTGSFEAAVEAAACVDRCLGRVVEAVQAAGGELLITADHGNAEQMRGEGTGQAHTAHTSNPVPLIYIGRPATLAPHGVLADVAPSLLQLMGFKQPEEMTGRSLIEHLEEHAPVRRSAAGR